MGNLTRRAFGASIAGIPCLRADQPLLAVFGLDHIKLSVSSAGVSAQFYAGLFGAETLRVQNRTLPNTTEVEEFFLKIGSTPCPYLILSQVRPNEFPGLDHVAVLARDALQARAILQREAVLADYADQAPRLRDPDGSLIELTPQSSWDKPLQSMRRPLPVEFRSMQPAFTPGSIKRLALRTANLQRSGDFYRQFFGGETEVGPRNRTFALGNTALQLTSGKPQLDHLAIAIRNFRHDTIRRILIQRGIRPYGAARGPVMFQDPDGNEVQLIGE